MKEVVIIKTGVANVASVEAAFKRCGVSTILTDDPQRIDEAQRVVLPGVGSFGTAIAKLRESQIDQVLTQRINADRPLLGICLGMQLLFRESDESPNIQGLGIFKAKISAMREPQLRVPHFGWNRVQALGNPKYLSTGFAYFAHSFRVLESDLDQDVQSGTVTKYGLPFISAIERGRLLACQFHPEISGPWGSKVLTRWLEGTC